jgi:tetraacyldisaccharide 4'-kinase
MNLYLLAKKLRGIAAVISDANRVTAAQGAIKHLRTDCFLLDDGFQYRRLARDLDIVTIDATNPFGGRRMLPTGRLREPLEV